MHKRNILEANPQVSVEVSSATAGEAPPGTKRQKHQESVEVSSDTAGKATPDTKKQLFHEANTASERM